MWNAANPTGRLITAGWTSMRNLEETRAYQKAVMELVTKVKHPVVCTDWSQAAVMPPDVAVEMLAMLAATNNHIERVAQLLAPERATFNLQAERLVRDAKNPSRRTFRDKALLLAWLGEVLTPVELRAAEEHIK